MSGSYEQDDPQLNLDTTPDPLESSLTQAGVGLPPPPEEPAVYKAMPDSRIPVSSKRGGIWRSRRDTAQKSMGDLIDAWDEAIGITITIRQIIETVVILSLAAIVMWLVV